MADFFGKNKYLREVQLNRALADESSSSKRSSEDIEDATANARNKVSKVSKTVEFLQRSKPTPDGENAVEVIDELLDTMDKKNIELDATTRSENEAAKEVQHTSLPTNRP